MDSPTAIRVGAWIRRTITSVVIHLLVRAIHRLPYFPDPNAHCVAHGSRFRLRCNDNEGLTECQDCGVYESTGMHWDTCPRRTR